MLTRDLILSAPSTPKPVDVPEWGGQVFVRMMTGTERMRYEEYGKTNPEALLAAVTLCFTVCNEAGDLLFTEADIPALQAKPMPVLYRVHAEAEKLNRLKARDIEAAAGE